MCFGSWISYDNINNIIKLIGHLYHLLLTFGVYIFHEVLQVTHDFVLKTLEILQLSVNGIKSTRWRVALFLTNIWLAHAALNLLLLFPIQTHLRILLFSRSYSFSASLSGSSILVQHFWRRQLRTGSSRGHCRLVYARILMGAVSRFVLLRCTLKRSLLHFFEVREALTGYRINIIINIVSHNFLFELAETRFQLQLFLISFPISQHFHDISATRIFLILFLILLSIIIFLNSSTRRVLFSNTKWPLRLHLKLLLLFHINGFLLSSLRIEAGWALVEHVLISIHLLIYIFLCLFFDGYRARFVEILWSIKELSARQSSLIMWALRISYFVATDARSRSNSTGRPYTYAKRLARLFSGFHF